MHFIAICVAIIAIAALPQALEVLIDVIAFVERLLVAVAGLLLTALCIGVLFWIL